MVGARTDKARSGVRSALGDYGADHPEVADALHVVATEVDRLWADVAALRDDLHALSNRIGSVTAAVAAHDVILAERGQG